MHDKWLPVESVRVILLSAETLCRKDNHAGSLGKKQEIADSHRRKPNMTDSLSTKRKLADWFIPCDDDIKFQCGTYMYIGGGGVRCGGGGGVRN